jgi:hypothetical protein
VKSAGNSPLLLIEQIPQLGGGPGAIIVFPDDVA